MPSRRQFLAQTLHTIVAGTILTSCEYDQILYPQNLNSVKIDLTNQLSDNLYGPGNKRLILDFLGAGFSKSIDGVNFGIPLIIARIKKEDKEDDFSCFTSVCTHMNCHGLRTSIGALNNNRHIVCQCHSSRFDAFDHGKVIQGPAEIPLKEFRTKYFPETKTLEIFY